MSTVKSVTLSEIAKSIKVDPKLARRKLRKADASIRNLSRDKKRWDFPASAKRKVVDFLKK